ncbi:MAG: formylglycine-generating enzyme family protein [Pseudomonadota bacterium]
MTITMFDIVFWLMIAMIATLAFAIESGVANRHRGVVVSSMLAGVISAVLMLFHVEDRTSFEFDPVGKNMKSKIKKQQLTLEEDTAAELDPNAEAPVDTEYKGPKFTASAAGLRDCDGCPTVVVIDRGHYYIGSPTTEKGRGVGEGPLKEVIVPQPIAIGKYELLVGEYRRFVEATGHQSLAVCKLDENDVEPRTWDNPGFAQTDRHPVVCVSYEDVQAYLAWINELTGRTYRLLSQVEWEYVARAKTRTPYFFGREILPEQANFDGANNGTKPSGSFSANAFKLYDLHGNAWELTADCWTPDLERVPKDGKAIGLAGDCTRHVMKGGGWDSTKDKLRSARRSALPNNVASPVVGFRVAREM